MSLVSRIIENHTYLTLGLLTTFYCLPSKPLPVHFQRDAICRLEAVSQRERFYQFTFVEIAGGHELDVVESGASTKPNPHHKDECSRQ